MEKMEIRSITSLNANADNMSVEGLVNKTDSWSNILGNKKKFREKVIKGAFTQALSRAFRVDFLSEHQKDKILASTENGTLELYEDSEGLQMKANIVPTSYGKDTHTLIENKIINHMSFGFKVIKDKWTKNFNDGIFERVIEEIELTEVSAVRNPAYAQSVIEARDIEILEDLDIPEVEEQEEVRMEQNMEELKRALKEEILAEMKAEKDAVKEEERLSDVEKKLVEQEIQEDVIEDKLDKQEDKLELEAKKKLLEDRVQEEVPSTTLETPAENVEVAPVAVEEDVVIEVTVSEKCEVSEKTKLADGTIDEVVEEVETSKSKIVDREEANKLFALYKQNQSDRF